MTIRLLSIAGLALLLAACDPGSPSTDTAPEASDAALTEPAVEASTLDARADATPPDTTLSDAALLDATLPDARTPEDAVNPLCPALPYCAAGGGFGYAWQPPGMREATSCVSILSDSQADLLLRGSWLGRVLSSEVDAGRPTLTLDLCAPGTGCGPELAYLRGATTAIALPALVPGQLVEVRWDNTLAYCGATLEVRNVASWAGASNPVRADNALLFAVARRTGYAGAPAVLAEPELTVSYVPLGCGWRTNSGFPADLYTLTAAPAALDGGPSSGGFGLGEGQSATLSVGSLRYRVENRRSCHSGAVDESDRFLVAVSLVP